MGLRILWLHIRSRAPTLAIVSLIVITGLSWYTVTYQGDELVTLFLIVAIPILPAIVVGISLNSRVRLLETTLPQSTVYLELIHVAGYIAITGLAMVIPTLDGTGQISWDLTTNLFGYTGLILIWAAIKHPRLGWLLPIGYGFATYLPLLQDPNQLSNIAHDPWLWPILPAANNEAVISEISILCAGFIGFALQRARRHSLP